MACGGCSCGHQHTTGAHPGGGGGRASLVAGLLIAAAVVVGTAVALQPADPASPPATPAPAPPPAPAADRPEPAGKPDPEADILGLTLRRIDGTEQPLAEYRGKVVMIVNVASRCGNTRQYAGLQNLHEEKKDAGLVVLGLPANNFGGQEPGTNAQIAEFCKDQYQVTFPMFEKISVKGEDAHPLYKRLAAARPSPDAPPLGEPDWNFGKYLIGRDGQVAARFKAAVKPEDRDLRAKVEELLAAPAPAEKGRGAGIAPAGAVLGP